MSATARRTSLKASDSDCSWDTQRLQGWLTLQRSNAGLHDEPEAGSPVTTWPTTCSTPAANSFSPASMSCKPRLVQSAPLTAWQALQCGSQDSEVAGTCAVRQSLMRDLVHCGLCARTQAHLGEEAHVALQGGGHLQALVAHALAQHLYVGLRPYLLLLRARPDFSRGI